MMRYYRLPVPTLLGLLLTLGCGCSPENEKLARQISPEIVLIPQGPIQGEPQGIALPRPNRSPYGIWLLQDGHMLDGYFGFNVSARALILDASGHGRVFLHDLQTGTIDCTRVLNLFDGETLALDFSIEQHVFPRHGSVLFPLVFVEDDLLGLGDENGVIALFSRETELPPDVTCGELTVTEQFVNLPAPQFFTDLVLFDGDLVYSAASTSQIERFDLATKTMGAPLAPVNNRHVQTSQGNHFWTHCGCGGSRDAFRRDLNTVFDTVSSEDELGGAFTMRAMAYDPVMAQLWLHGRAFSGNRGAVQNVDTSGEPDQLVQTFSFDRDLRALGFDWTSMWAIEAFVSQTIVRIDMTTGKVAESFEVPNEDVQWNGLVFDTVNMYLLGTDPSGMGIIVTSPRRNAGNPGGGPGNR